MGNHRRGRSAGAARAVRRRRTGSESTGCAPRRRPTRRAHRPVHSGRQGERHHVPLMCTRIVVNDCGPRSAAAATCRCHPPAVTDSAEAVDALLHDFAAGRLADPGRDPDHLTQLVESRLSDVVDKHGWARIDRRERRAGRSLCAPAEGPTHIRAAGDLPSGVLIWRHWVQHPAASRRHGLLVGIARQCTARSARRAEPRPRRCPAWSAGSGITAVMPRRRWSAR
jgi:hypothetical protein